MIENVTIAMHCNLTPTSRRVVLRFN